MTSGRYFILCLLLGLHKINFSVSDMYFVSGSVRYTYSPTFSKCILGEQINTLTGLSFPKCVEECKLRKSCEALTYRRRLKVCELFNDKIDRTEKQGDCTSVNATDIKTSQETCSGDCHTGQVCKKSTQTCEYRECPPLPQLQDGELLGNILSVGSRIRVVCDAGYYEKQGANMTTCLENGTWSVNPKCLPVSPIGKPCTNDGVCRDANAVCHRFTVGQGSICLCNISYGLNDVSGSCEKCSSYTSEYTEYKDMFAGPDIDWVDSALDVTSRASFEKCLQSCKEMLGDMPKTFMVWNYFCSCKDKALTEILMEGWTLSPNPDFSVFDRKCLTEGQQ